MRLQDFVELWQVRKIDVHYVSKERPDRRWVCRVTARGGRTFTAMADSFNHACDSAYFDLVKHEELQ